MGCNLLGESKKSEVEDACLSDAEHAWQHVTLPLHCLNAASDASEPPSVRSVRPEYGNFAEANHDVGILARQLCERANAVLFRFARIHLSGQEMLML